MMRGVKAKMKKVRIGKTIMDAIDEKEYMRRVSINPNANNELSNDTAVLKGDTVYPIQKSYSKDAVGVYDAGPVLVYSRPQNMIDTNEYSSDNVIDFENSSSLRESIEKTARLVNEERTILISLDNIYTPLIKENDTPEMALFKKAIAEKQIDIENYKPRFGSDYSNDLRALSGNSITFFKLKRMCDIFDMNCMVTFEDKEGAPNPIGERLTICINNSQVPGQTKIESSDSKDEEDN